MKNSPILQTRREFLTAGIKGVGLLAVSGFVPSFLMRTAQAAGADKDSRILVVIQLSGGNDGLNTIIPYADDLYYKARPTIGIKAKDTLKLDSHIGLNPSLMAIQREFDQGRVAIIQNVGYPNPNRSHFRATEIWETAEDSTGRRLTDGWLGRYFDAKCNGADPHKARELADIGVSFGKVMPQTFRNQSNVALAVENPKTFLWNPSGETVGLEKAQEAIFSKLNDPNPSGGRMHPDLTNLGGITGNEPATLDFLKHTAMNAVLAGDQIRGILNKHKTTGSKYPHSQLANQLAMISKLIAGGFPARVYYAVQGGFDTHAHQTGTQNKLLADVAESVHAFMEDLREQKNSERVMLLSFSEFGRRVAENGSAGTDHGTAAPMFLFGDKIKGGIHGHAPDLKNLVDGDLRYQTDFRQVYAGVLEDWLGTNSETVLHRKFAKIPVV